MLGCYRPQFRVIPSFVRLRTPLVLDVSQVSATLVFALSVVSNARGDTKDSKFDDVMTNIYLVLGYLAIGSAGLWGFFRTHNVPLTPPEVRAAGSIRSGS